MVMLFLSLSFFHNGLLRLLIYVCEPTLPFWVPILTSSQWWTVTQNCEFRSTLSTLAVSVGCFYLSNRNMNQNDSLKENRFVLAHGSDGSVLHGGECVLEHLYHGGRRQIKGNTGRGQDKISPREILPVICFLQLGPTSYLFTNYK